MNITIELPESFNIYFDKENIQQELKKNSALILYKQGKISLSRASELADMNIYAFIEECKKNQIPVLDYSTDDIDAEIHNIKKRT